MGVLSRTEMEQAITHDRGAVLYQGRLITRVADLPTDADLAKGNPEQEAAAAAALDAQIAALQTQRVRLTGGQSPQIGPPPAPAGNQPAAIADRPSEGMKGDSDKEQPARHASSRQKEP